MTAQRRGLHAGRGFLFGFWQWWVDSVWYFDFLWAPLAGCWIRGHEDDSYGRCVWCRREINLGWPHGKGAP